MKPIEIVSIKKTNKPYNKYSTSKIEFISLLNRYYSCVKVEYDNGDIENRLYILCKDYYANIAGILWDIYTDKNIHHLQLMAGNTPIFDCINPKSYDYLYERLKNTLIK